MVNPNTVSSNALMEEGDGVPFLGKTTNLVYAIVLRCLTICEFIIRVAGFLMSRMRFRCVMRLLYRPRPDDVFIVSYPKAGTTVMQMILYQLTTDGDMSFRHIDDVVPWFERWLSSNPKALEMRPTPRVFKTHLTLNRLPKRAKCVYLVREPKDSCVSYFHHLRSLSGARAPMDAFVNQFIRGRVPMGSWFNHVLSCSRALADRQVLVVGYNDIVQHREEVIERVANFCAIALSDERKERTAERAGFAFMKEHNAKFDPRLTAGALHLEETQFVRRGVVGSWVDDLSPTQATRIEERMQSLFGGGNSILPVSVAQALGSSIAPVRGNILVDLANSEQCALIANKGSTVPLGLRLLRSQEPLHNGDVVRLTLRAGDYRVTIARAEAISVSRERDVEIMFRSVESEEAQKLALLCQGELRLPAAEKHGAECCASA